MPEESKTPDPVELTRLAFEAVNRRDIDAVVSFFAPDGVLDGRAAGGLYEGRAAIHGFLDDWFDSFAELHRVVAGWEDVCGEPGSIDWLLARVGRVLVDAA